MAHFPKSFTPPIMKLERDLVQKVCDGHPTAALFIYHMRETCRVAKDVDYLRLLQWLIGNRVTGQALVDFLACDCNNNPVEAVAQIRRRYNKDRDLQKVFGQ